MPSQTATGPAACPDPKDANWLALSELYLSLCRIPEVFKLDVCGHARLNKHMAPDFLTPSRLCPKSPLKAADTASFPLMLPPGCAHVHGFGRYSGPEEGPLEGFGGCSCWCSP